MMSTWRARMAQFYRGSAILVSFVAFSVAGSVAASADLIVLQSSAPGLKSGSSLSDSANINIPSGKSAVFVLPSGATKTVSGPYSGKASDFTKGQSTNAALLDAVKKYVSTGGADTSGVGAMRSAGPSRSRKRGGFSWTEVPINANGDYCLAKGERLMLARSPGDTRALDVTLIDMQSSTRAKVSFERGKRRLLGRTPSHQPLASTPSSRKAGPCVSCSCG